MADLLDAPRIHPTQSQLKYSEAHVLDISSLKETGGRERAIQVIKEASPTGLLHVINHELASEDFHFLRSVGYTYMTQRTLDEKDHDASRWCKGSFEGYKSRTEAEIKAGVTSPIEQYDYEFHATGKIQRPPMFASHEERIQRIFDYYHNTLTPTLLSLINDFCQLPEGTLERIHKDSSDIAHFVFYKPGWDKNITKRKAQYAGHTDIGSITYLAANPVASLQVYTSEGWRYVQYIPDSILVNAGDAMEFLTEGKVNATLHRLVKPQPDQMSQPRLAVVYFVNPDHEHMTKAIRFHQTLREEATIKCTKSPGAPVNGAALDRLISAISAVDNDEYRQVVDERAFNAAKSGSLVSTPPGLAVDYTSLAIRPVPEAVGKAKSLPIAKRAGVAA